MGYHWNWEILVSPVPTGETTYLAWLLSGLETTVALSLAAWLIALVIGTFMGVARTMPNRWLAAGARLYVEVFRNVPLLVQLFVWYFVVPEIAPGGLAFKQIAPTTQQFLASLVCLALFTGARVCEQVRAGIESLPPGQKNAGLALGLTLAQTYRYLLVPMAARRIVPTLTSETLNILKNSAVCSTIGLLELAAEGGQLVEYTAQPYESFIAVTGLYLGVNALVVMLMRKVEERARIRGFIGAEK